MNITLNINSPAYYNSIHGVVDEVYRMCHNIECSIDIKKYTNSLECIGITPYIVPNKIIKKEKWKEVKRVLLKAKIAIISLHIDYDTYLKADVNEKKKLILQNVFDSLMIISRKIKNDFNYELFVKDILNIV